MFGSCVGDACLRRSLSVQNKAVPTKILLDTDPGSDIDDSLAISYLLKQPECDLVGIATVTGDVARRAAIVEVLCNAAKKPKIPIVCGRRNVLLYGPGQPHVPQYDLIAKHPHTLHPKPDHAVEFLRETIRKRPGQITLLSIGPYSNVGLLFAIDPEIPYLLKSFVSMAGAFHGFDNREWNCICDPVSTGIVAATPRPYHRWIGLDVTTKCTMGKEECHAHFKGPLLELVLEMAGEWFERGDRITFHDPLAAVTVFEPSICTYAKGAVSVDAKDGKTTFTEGHGVDEIAVDVDSARFFTHYFSVVGA